MLGMFQLKGTSQSPSCSGERKETHLSVGLGQAGGEGLSQKGEGRQGLGSARR